MDTRNVHSSRSVSWHKGSIARERINARAYLECSALSGEGVQELLYTVLLMTIHADHFDSENGLIDGGGIFELEGDNARREVRRNIFDRLQERFGANRDR